MAAVNNGRITAEQLDESVRRILTAKERYGILDDPWPQESILKATLAAPEHLAVAEHVARASLTLVRDDRGLLPSVTAHTPVPLVWPTELEGILAPLLEECTFLQPYLVPVRADAEELARLTSALAGAPVVVVGTYDLHRNTAWAELVRALGADRVVAVAMRSPYDLLHIPEVGTYVAAYSDRPVSMQALGRLLQGNFAPQGHLPVELPGLYPEGWRLNKSAGAN